MKFSKKTLCLVAILFINISISAQKLTFSKEGSFKIVQFTDVHYAYGNVKSDTAFLLINRVLDAEKPDLVIFTGDIVTEKPVKEGWDAVTKLVSARKIPFAVTLGNHDDEHGVTRAELEKLITAYPYNINTPTNGSATSGVMNNALPVFGSEKDMQVKAVLYCLDSGAYSTISDVKGYGWITPDVIDWYKKTSLQFTIRNNFQPLPALAFFHIPLPEYRFAFDNQKNTRFGTREEEECSPELNSGMFLAMREARDVMGIFTGHDHKNNYIVNYHDVALAYGAFSGWRTTYTPKMNGARVIVLKEGVKGFETWIRFLDGSIQQKVSFPADFRKDKK